MQIAYLDGPRLRRSLVAACEYAQKQRTELNRINVFPVPDGDTGTNLALTVRAIADHLRANRDPSVSAVALEAAQAAVLGARGNAGMMLSHFLLGFAEALRDRVRVGTREFGTAMRVGADNLLHALERPVEGTILTVMRDTADAAVRAAHTDFAALLGHLVEEARASLARTPELLPVLKRAGVVDAGAKGFVSLLEGVLHFMQGEWPTASIEAPAYPDEPEAAAARVDFRSANGGYRYCTEALVRGAALPTQDRVRSHLHDRGDSLIVIRSANVLKVHIHTDDPEQVFSYLRGLGTLVTHKAEDMRAQHAAVERAAAHHVRLARRPISIVTDSGADLPEEIVRAHGIHVTPLLLVEGDRTYRDGVDITARQFHARMATEDPLPTTSQPAPADFLETYERAAEDGETVLGVILGSSLSGTFGSARAAATRFGGAPIRLVDTLGISLLQGLLVLKACELAELAMAPEDIARELQRIRRRSGILFTVETFERLLASGRVTRGRALLGSMLSVKPILLLNEDGVIEPVTRALGSARAQTALLEALAERVPGDVRKVRFGVVHAGDDAIVAQVSGALRNRYGYDVEILASPATPVISAHLGLGAWGVAWMIED